MLERGSAPEISEVVRVPARLPRLHLGQGRGSPALAELTSSLADIDYSELQANPGLQPLVLFQNQVTSEKAAVAALAAQRNRDEEKGIVILKCFDVTRNICTWAREGVALRALDVPWLCDAATALDLRGRKLEAKRVTPKGWEQLVKYWPTGAELQELEDYAFGRKMGALRGLEQALPLLRIPDLNFRLRLLDLSQSMPATMDQLSQQLACVQKACRQLRESESLRQFLAVTLAACTYLNTGTTAEDIRTDASVASFFEVQELTKLAQHKLHVTTEGVGLGMQQGMCLMHFMVKQMRLKRPDRRPRRALRRSSHAWRSQGSSAWTR
ncbi:unnamed protein product [Effrenium voratum]|nr:unnamed protein product [Effrenium voratum]